VLDVTQLAQNTPAWLQARCGSIGASDAPRAVRKLASGGYSADRAKLRGEKVVERLTGNPKEIPKTAAMLQGTAREPDGRLMYSIVMGVDVEEIAIVAHPTIKGSHASPDGLVGAEGLIEIKCPLETTHVEALEDGQISRDHIVQMQWQMACTGRAWCDFVSFNPDFPLPMQLWVKRVHRDRADIADLEREIAKLVREIDDQVERLTRRYERVQA
jgi:putative phage-type endonuclease